LWRRGTEHFQKSGLDRLTWNVRITTDQEMRGGRSATVFRYAQRLSHPWGLIGSQSITLAGQGFVAIELFVRE
jgi:hypothetical protein